MHLAESLVNSFNLFPIPAANIKACIFSPRSGKFFQFPIQARHENRMLNNNKKAPYIKIQRLNTYRFKKSRYCKNQLIPAN